MGFTVATPRYFRSFSFFDIKKYKMGRINQKTMRMFKDGDDSHGLQMMNLNNLG